MKFHLLLATVLTIFVMSVGVAVSPTNSAVKIEARSLKDSLRPAPKNCGFAMEYGLGGWTKYSEQRPFKMWVKQD
jgi:hypothetical protein